MWVDFWNIGQGDASSICWEEAEDGVEHLDLIDIGPSGTTQLSEYFVPRSKVRSWQIDNLVLTHNDIDHIGGLTWLKGKGGLVKIGKVFVLDDWQGKPERKNSLAWLMNQVGNGNLKRLEHPLTIATHGEYSLEVLYPSFQENIQHECNPNETSGVLALKWQDKPLVVWGGDNRLKTLADVAPAGSVWLFGPHHGAPQDRNKKTFCAHASAIGAQNCLLSFCTKNGYGHPFPQYVGALSACGCNVVCLQQARQCAEKRHTLGLNGDGVLGLWTPPSPAVQCHGHVRLQISNGLIQDELATEFEEVKTRWGKRLCAPCLSSCR